VCCLQSASTNSESCVPKRRWHGTCHLSAPCPPDRARRALQRERAHSRTVKSVALELGFWHLGRFADSTENCSANRRMKPCAERVEEFVQPEPSGIDRSQWDIVRRVATPSLGAIVLRPDSRSNTKPPWPRRAVPAPQGADADQTAHAVARHRRDQGACCDGQEANLAERVRPVPNELTTASQPFKRNGLSP
jgi:hypothetical protein